MRGPQIGVLLIFVFVPRCVSKFVFTLKTQLLAMIDVNDISRIVCDYLDSLEDRGYYLVHSEVRGANEIIIEIDHDEKPIDIDTIVSVTRHIEGVMNRDEEDYELTVSSAGLTSPLRQPRQYRKYIGKGLVVVLRSGVKEQGVLASADEMQLTLEVTRMVKPEGERRKRAISEMLTIPYSDIKSAVYDLKV